MPLNVELTLDFLFKLTRYLQFQTTIAYLKDPPNGSEQVPVDIFGGIEIISNAVKDGTINGQYEFELQLTTLISTAHDGHFSLELNMINQIFFQAPFSLLSLSVDGNALPKVFIKSS